MNRLETKKIHILGASGAGTSTLGKLLEAEYGFVHLDTDDYYWLPTNPPFTTPREITTRINLLKKDILHHDQCVISGSLCGWGDVLIPYFDLIIRVVTPTDVRIERLHQREFKRFGNRILENGDMYEEHQRFITWASQYDTGGLDIRSKALHDEWLKEISCRQVEIDGTHVAQQIKQIENYMK